MVPSLGSGGVEVGRVNLVAELGGDIVLVVLVYLVVKNAEEVNSFPGKLVPEFLYH